MTEYLHLFMKCSAYNTKIKVFKSVVVFRAFYDEFEAAFPI